MKTHYWTIKNEISDIDWNMFCNIVKKLIDKTTVTICDGFGECEPLLTNEDIFINGDASTGEDYETFCVSRDAIGVNDFCKTGNRPYDEIVVASLFVGKRLNILDWYSDGCEDNGDFISAKKLLDSIA